MIQGNTFLGGHVRPALGAEVNQLAQASVTGGTFQWVSQFGCHLNSIGRWALFAWLELDDATKLKESPYHWFTAYILRVRSCYFLGG